MRFRTEQLTDHSPRQRTFLALYQLLLLSLLLGFYTPATAQQPNNSLSKPLVSGMYAHIQVRIHPSYAEAIDALLQLKGKNVRELLGLAGFEVGLDQQYENFRTDMQSAKGFDGEK